MRVEFDGIERRGQPFVSRDRYPAVLHDPLTLSEQTVNAPVYEHSELGVSEPLSCLEA